MRQSTCRRTLECKLTEKEFTERAKALSQALANKDRAEGRLKSATSQIKAEIEEHTSEYKSLQVVVASGLEFREITCNVVYDWDAKTKSIIRPDTGEIIDVDIIPESDLQEHMEGIAEENKILNMTPENEGMFTAPISESVEAEPQL